MMDFSRQCPACDAVGFIVPTLWGDPNPTDFDAADAAQVKLLGDIGDEPPGTPKYVCLRCERDEALAALARNRYDQTLSWPVTDYLIRSANITRSRRELPPPKWRLNHPAGALADAHAKRVSRFARSEELLARASSAEVHFVADAVANPPELPEEFLRALLDPNIRTTGIGANYRDDGSWVITLLMD